MKKIYPLIVGIVIVIAIIAAAYASMASQIYSR